MRRTSLLLVFVALALAGCNNAEPEGGTPEGDSSAPSVTDTAPAADTVTTIPTFSLFGRVIDSESRPVPGAVVTLAGEVATTGPDGWFNLESPTVGQVTAEKSGWSSAEAAWDGSTSLLEISIDPITVRALRVAADVSGDLDRFEELLQLADETAVNSLVFDTKIEGGRVLYDTSVEVAHEIGAVINNYDPVQLLAMAKEHDLYTITRIVSFDDDFKAKAYPSHAIAGRWIDPRVEEAWQYNLDLAVEACELGFDEIQFDYVRFPSGEAVKVSGQLDMSQEERVGAITAYLAQARSILRPMGCAVSADIFGIVVSSPTDQGIGQRPEELSTQLDVVSPMVYPSHYSDGWLGYDDPNEHPYDVTADSIDDALPRLEPGTHLRPWLQAFWWTDAQIRRSIQAAEDRGVGWMLWNALGNYSKAALPTDAEVSG